MEIDRWAGYFLITAGNTTTMCVCVCVSILVSINIAIMVYEG